MDDSADYAEKRRLLAKIPDAQLRRILQELLDEAVIAEADVPPPICWTDPVGGICPQGAPERKAARRRFLS